MTTFCRTPILLATVKLSRSGCACICPRADLLTLAVPSHRDLPVGAPSRLAACVVPCDGYRQSDLVGNSPVLGLPGHTRHVSLKILSRHGGIRADPIVYSTTKTITVKFAHLPSFYSQAISTTPSVNIDRRWTKSWIFYRQWQSHICPNYPNFGNWFESNSKEPPAMVSNIGFWSGCDSLFHGQFRWGFQPSGGGVLGMPQARWRYSGMGRDIISITAESCRFSDDPIFCCGIWCAEIWGLSSGNLT